MSAPVIGIFVFLGLALLAGVVWHSVVSKYYAASLLAGTTAAILFQVVDYLHIGYLDPFFPIALVSTSGLGFLISLLVGLPFRSRRNRSHVGDGNA